jgi:two-component system, NarL family, response regulator DevR
LTARQAARPAQVGRSKGSAPTLGIVLIDPLHVVRAGLKLFIEEQPDMQVMSEAGTADDALQAVRSLRRKTRVIVLVGLGLDGKHDAFWLIRTVRETFPSVVVLALGANADGMMISRSLFMGAHGYVDKNSNPPDFLDGLRRAAEGDVVLTGLPRDWLGSIADGLERQRAVAPLLTDRELEVLSVAAEGLTAKKIGERLGVRERTVTTHLGRIYSKLGVPGRIGAVRAAARVGLVAIRTSE